MPWSASERSIRMTESALARSRLAVGSTCERFRASGWHGGKKHILERREAGEENSALVEVPDGVPAPGRYRIVFQSGKAVPRPDDLAGGGRNESGGYSEDARFARSAAAGQAVHRAGSEAEVVVVDDSERLHSGTLEADAQPAQFQC